MRAVALCALALALAALWGATAAHAATTRQAPAYGGGIPWLVPHHAQRVQLVLTRGYCTPQGSVRQPVLLHGVPWCAVQARWYS